MCTDQQYRWVSIRGMVVERDASGVALRMTGTILDVDERRRLAEERQQLEAQLRQSQKISFR
jgi:PAS domain-containing protein